jgi:hypothetical protein
MEWCPIVPEQQAQLCMNENQYGSIYAGSQDFSPLTILIGVQAVEMLPDRRLAFPCQVKNNFKYQ